MDGVAAGPGSDERSGLAFVARGTSVAYHPHSMAIGLAIDPRFRAHAPPRNHPERPERIAAIEALLEKSGLRARTTPLRVRAATRDELGRVHGSPYLDSLERTLGGLAGKAFDQPGATGFLDEDTYFSPGTWEAILLAAGTAVEAARGVASGELSSAAAVLRPPGHHATRDRAMGFCFLNNAAVAAASLVAEGLRVAVVDFDVHHGNGTQDIFWNEPRVLYASTHQSPLYPGTGAVDERGGDAGLGSIVNVPLPAGSGDAALLGAFDQVILPALDRFAPDVVIASAGFDAHAGDPLAGLSVTTEGFARITERLRVASDGKVVALLEGGYDLDDLAHSFAAMLGVLLGDAPPPAIDDIGASHPLPADQRAALHRAAKSLAALRPPAP